MYQTRTGQDAIANPEAFREWGEETLAMMRRGRTPANVLAILEDKWNDGDPYVDVQLAVLANSTEEAWRVTATCRAMDEDGLVVSEELATDTEIGDEQQREALLGRTAGIGNSALLLAGHRRVLVLRVCPDDSLATISFGQERE